MVAETGALLLSITMPRQNTMKKYNVSIEQPMCKTWEVEAETIEQAIEIATQNYNNGDFIIGPDDIGTAIVPKRFNEWLLTEI